MHRRLFSDKLVILFTLVGRFTLAANFGITYIYTAEVFPTVVRNAAAGFSSVASRIGSISAPQIALLVKRHSTYSILNNFKHIVIWLSVRLCRQLGAGSCVWLFRASSSCGRLVFNWDQRKTFNRNSGRRNWIAQVKHFPVQCE